MPTAGYHLTVGSANANGYALLLALACRRHRQTLLLTQTLRYREQYKSANESQFGIRLPTLGLALKLLTIYLVGRTIID